MCDSNIYQVYKVVSKVPTKDLTYDQILFLTAHRHCCGKKLMKDNTKHPTSEELTAFQRGECITEQEYIAGFDIEDTNRQG